MNYILFFVIGFIGGGGAVLIIRLRNTYRRKTYGFSETIPALTPSTFSSDDESKYAPERKSVDGREAMREFKQ